MNNNSALKLGKNLLLILLAVFFILAIVGYGYQSMSEMQDMERFPADGQFVWVKDTTMHIHCMGEGSPTVVLEQGLGYAGIAWRHLQEELAKTTRTCVYDRPGMGYSKSTGEALSGNQVAQYLNVLLENAGIDDDIILAGWSLGGIYARAYYQQFPDNVKGMVFIDSSHEQQEARLPGSYVPGSWEVTLDHLKWRFGIHRYQDYVGPQVDFMFEMIEVSPTLVAHNKAIFNKVSHNISATEELLKFVEDSMVAPAPKSLGNLPITVISAGVSYSETEEDKAFSEAWEIMQQEQTALSTKGKRVIAEEAGHGIPYEQPAIIVDEVKALVESLRGE